MFRPTRTSRWKDTLEKAAGKPLVAEKALTADAARYELSSLFDRTATADKLEADGQIQPQRRCPQPVIDGPAGKCGLVLRGNEARCTFHTAPGRFVALELGAGDVYRNSPAARRAFTP